MRDGGARTYLPKTLLGDDRVDHCLQCESAQLKCVRIAERRFRYVAASY